MQSISPSQVSLLEKREKRITKLLLTIQFLMLAGLFFSVINSSDFVANANADWITAEEHTISQKSDNYSFLESPFMAYALPARRNPKPAK